MRMTLILRSKLTLFILLFLFFTVSCGFDPGVVTNLDSDQSSDHNNNEPDHNSDNPEHTDAERPGHADGQKPEQEDGQESGHAGTEKPENEEGQESERGDEYSHIDREEKDQSDLKDIKAIVFDGTKMNYGSSISVFSDCNSDGIFSEGTDTLAEFIQDKNHYLLKGIDAACTIVADFKDSTYGLKYYSTVFKHSDFIDDFVLLSPITTLQFSNSLAKSDPILYATLKRGLDSIPNLNHQSLIYLSFNEFIGLHRELDWKIDRFNNLRNLLYTNLYDDLQSKDNIDIAIYSAINSLAEILELKTYFSNQQYIPNFEHDSKKFTLVNLFINSFYGQIPKFSDYEEFAHISYRFNFDLSDGYINTIGTLKLPPFLHYSNGEIKAHNYNKLQFAFSFGESALILEDKNDFSCELTPANKDICYSKLSAGFGKDLTPKEYFSYQFEKKFAPELFDIKPLDESALPPDYVSHQVNNLLTSDSSDISTLESLTASMSKYSIYSSIKSIDGEESLRLTSIPAQFTEVVFNVESDIEDFVVRVGGWSDDFYKISKGENQIVKVPMIFVNNIKFAADTNEDFSSGIRTFDYYKNCNNSNECSFPINYFGGKSSENPFVIKFYKNILEKDKAEIFCNMPSLLNSENLELRTRDFDGTPKITCDSNTFLDGEYYAMYDTEKNIFYRLFEINESDIDSNFNTSFRSLSQVVTVLNEGEHESIPVNNIGELHIGTVSLWDAVVSRKSISVYHCSARDSFSENFFIYQLPNTDGCDVAYALEKQNSVIE